MNTKANQLLVYLLLLARLLKKSDVVEFCCVEDSDVVLRKMKGLLNYFVVSELGSRDRGLWWWLYCKVPYEVGTLPYPRLCPHTCFRGAAVDRNHSTFTRVSRLGSPPPESNSEARTKPYSKGQRPSPTACP